MRFCVKEKEIDGRLTFCATVDQAFLAIAAFSPKIIY